MFKNIAVTSLLCILSFVFPQKSFSDNIEKANKLYAQYDYQFAIPLYEKEMLKKPSLRAAQNLANCYRFINNTEKAQDAYAKVLTFADADPVNYKYYGDALKQNGKFEEAKASYLKYGEKLPAKSAEANQLAVSNDFAKQLSENPHKAIKVNNESDLNSKFSDFSPVKYNSGYVFVSDREVEGSSINNQIYGWTGNPYLKLYEADYQNSAVQLKRFPELINNKYHNGPAVFTPDGNGIFFTRTDPDFNKKAKGIKVGKKQIYYSAKADGNWGEPQLLPLNNEGTYSVQHPALSADGNTLYFASDMPGGSGGMDIYAAHKLADGTWGEIVNCGASVNTADDEVFPSVSIDGELHFSSKGRMGMGGLDIFKAKGSYNNFAEAENLKAPINSTKDDFGVWFFDPSSGFISSNRNGGQGLDDIYRFKVDALILAQMQEAEKPVFSVEGFVSDKTSAAALEGVALVLHNKLTGADVQAKSDNQGKFTFGLEGNSDYLVTVNDLRFLSVAEQHISTKGLDKSNTEKVNFELTRVGMDLVKIKNIYYNFNKWDLRKDAMPELAKLNKYLDANPNFRLELVSHTDAIGSANYNLWLSQKRAGSVVSYLQKNGISDTRLKAVGMGETQLLNNCTEKGKCDDAMHQLNRRTEFIIIRK